MCLTYVTTLSCNVKKLFTKIIKLIKNFIKYIVMGWNNLKAAIAAVIKTNDNQEITGANLQNVLLSIVNMLGANATYAGIAEPQTSPGVPDGPVFYIAKTSGTYPNFNNAVITSGINIIKWENDAWVVDNYPLLIADGAVTSAKIADGAVGNGKIANSAVSAEKIANSAVSAEKIANNAVTLAKINSSDIDDNPTLNSQKLVRSGGVKDAINYVLGKVQAIEALLSEDSDPTAAIDKFSEIVAFLSNINNTSTLEGIINGINASINTKYTKPSSGIPESDLDQSVKNKLAKAEGIPESDLDQSVKNKLAKAEGSYAKPSSGIPESDLDQSVKNKLAKAEGSYSKPSSGIPKSDLDQYIQAILNKADDSTPVRIASIGDSVLSDYADIFDAEEGIIVKTLIGIDYAASPAYDIYMFDSFEQSGGFLTELKFLKISKGKFDYATLTNDGWDYNSVFPDVSQLAQQVEELEDTAVRTGSYDASVAVGLADNLRGDTIVDAEFYKRKTGGTQSVGSGIAAIKEVRGKSIVWNQLIQNGDFSQGTTGWQEQGNYGSIQVNNNALTYSVSVLNQNARIATTINVAEGHKCLVICGIYSQYTFNAETRIRGTVSGVQIVTAGIFTQYAKIYTAGDYDNEFRIYLNSTNANVGDTVDITNVQVFDLTLMFGAGNEPATVEEFEKMFPLDYYDYNEGEVISFAGQNLTTTGKNQYNHATGKANLLGGQQYQIGGTYTGAIIDGVTVTLDSNNCFTTTKDCVLDITGGNDEDTFVSLYNGETNTYEPYEKHTLPLDPSQWRDKQGNLVFPYGGMHGVGTAYDYAKVDADGYIRKAVRVFGSVDLGSLDWEKRTISDVSYFMSNKFDGKNTSQNGAITNKYILKHVSPVYMNDKVFNINYWTRYNTVNIKDSAYTDAASFKSVLQGVVLYYELVEPVEVELATPIYAKYLVDKDGTEEITPVNGQEPYTTPANLSILYAMDARGEIKNLPKNYLSKESAENMLNAMVSAGIIASYTMTWDSANSRYAFVITAPIEPEPTPESEESNN